jgi:dTMP kinase
MIVIEGIEGAGKSTAIESVMTTLNSLGVNNIVKTREPGGTPIAELMRNLLKHGLEDEIPTVQTEVLMMYAARSQLLNNVIWPALKRGEWVVSDRHDLSSLAYQGGGRGIDKKVLETLSHFCVEGFKPSLTLFLDVNLEMSESRVVSRGKKDRIEKEERDFFKRVREAYLHYAENDPSIITIDANRSLSDVTKTIQLTIRQWYERRDAI